MIQYWGWGEGGAGRVESEIPGGRYQRKDRGEREREGMEGRVWVYLAFVNDNHFKNRFRTPREMTKKKIAMWWDD